MMDKERIKNYILEEFNNKIQEHIDNEEYEICVGIKEFIPKIENYDYDTLINILQQAEANVQDILGVQEELNENLTLELIKVQVYNDIGYKNIDTEKLIDKILNGDF